MVSAIWNERGQWDLKIQQKGGQTFSDYADILINANGLLKYVTSFPDSTYVLLPELTNALNSSWKWPNIEGLHDFKGPKIHSANWDYNVPIDSNTTVAVIGNGR